MPEFCNHVSYVQKNSPYHVGFVSCLKLFVYDIEQASLVIKDINLLLNGSCRLRFYCVDVNTVPHNLVARAGVTVSAT